MKVSLVMTAWNEEFRLGKTLPFVIEYMKDFGKRNNIETEIVIYNDGSKDKTKNLIMRYPEVRALSNDINHGKGYGLRQAVSAADGDYIYLTDADFSTPIDFIDKFYENMKDSDCVIGSRAIAQAEVKVSLLRKLLGNLGNLMIRLILGLDFKDTQCGFKMFNRESKKYFLDCKNERWGYDFEFLYLLKKNKLRVKEMPVNWEATTDTRVKPFDYFKTLYELIKVRQMHD